MNKRGLTLVETMVAIIILVIVNVTILATFVMLKASGVNMRHYLQAVNLLSAKLENLKSGSYASIGAFSNQPLTIDDNGTPLDASDDRIGTYSQAVSVTQDSGHVNAYKVIAATLVWQESSYAGVRDVSTSLVTIITE